VIAAMCYAAGMFAASYGILVNSKTYFAGEPAGEFEGFQQYLAHVQVAAGDKVQLCDAENRAVWAVDLNPASVEGFTREGDHYNVTVTGCYDFYIKLKYEADELYIGNGENCGEGIDISGGGNPGGQGGGDNPGGQGGSQGGVTGNPRYYYKGYIDNQDVEPSESTLFDHGMAELEVSENAYIFILYQVDGYPGEQYMTASYTDGVTHSTMLKTGGEKFHIGAGTYTLYLYDNGDGTLEVSTEPMPGKKLADPQPLQAINNTEVSEKAHKVMVDGQLRIVRGDKMFDATGREL
jgi:hypothetical protein